ncbi:MAG: hypothetical protein QM802_04985 [Agriterribacter sp.]
MVFFHGNDSLWEVKTTTFSIDGDWNGNNSRTCECNIDEADSLFDMVGKFSRELLLNNDRNKKLYHRRTMYAPHGSYNTQVDYVSDESGEVFLIDQYKYDNNCNLIQLDRRNKDSIVLKKYIFQHDKANNLTQWELYDATDLLLKKATYQYDKNNNETGYAIDDTKKKIAFNCSFTYDGIDTAGNWQKRIKLKNNKPVAITYRHIEYF